MFLPVRQLFAATGLFLLALAGLPATETRIAFLGDSITYAGGWPTRVESALRGDSKFRDAEIVNFGLPSETASGLSEPGHAGGKFARPCIRERLARILTQYKPTLVIAAYGMNDGIYLPQNKERFDAFKKGMTQLKKDVEAAGARIIFVTAPLYKADIAGKQAPYDAVLDDYAGWLNKQQRGAAWSVIDIRPELKKDVAAKKKNDAKFVYAGDGIHPGEAGHAMIAEIVCDKLWPALKLSGKPQIASGNALATLSKRNNLLKLAWLTKTGHARPGIPAGLPLDKAEKQAAALSEKYEKELSAKN